MTRTILLLFALFAEPRGPAQPRPDTAGVRLRYELVARADSLERLDPRRELAAALRRRDWRFIGIQGYAVSVPGVPDRDPLYPAQVAMNVVSGTSDGVWAPEVARLNRAGWAYAERYNRLLLRELRRARRPRARPADVDRAADAVPRVLVSQGL